MSDDRGGTWSSLSADPRLRAGVFRFGRNVHAESEGPATHDSGSKTPGSIGHVASSVGRGPDREGVASRPNHTSKGTSPRGNRQDEFC